MAKKVREKALDTRAAREKLKVSGKPYFRSLGPELHLGYRKGKDARRWVARLYLGKGQYRTENIGYADDVADADGAKVLDFWQAQDKARELEKVTNPTPDKYTVRQAIADYVIYLEGKPTQNKTKQRLAVHVPDALGEKPVASVTKEDLEAWKRNIIKQPPRARTAEGSRKKSFWNVDMEDEDVKRRRKSSANRIWTMLKAALNLAFANGKVPSDSAWRRVKAYKDVDVARDRYLSLAESKRLINASDPEFRPLVRAALETGARYSELTRLRVADYNPDSQTLHIRRSKSGKARHVALTEEGAELFASLAAGRAASAPLLGVEWRDSMQERRMRQTCKNAKIDPPITFHGLRHTWASLAVMGGMPLAVVAKNLGHASTAMVEKHYGHLAPSYIADAIRNHAPRFGGVASNVKAMR